MSLAMSGLRFFCLQILWLSTSCHLVSIRIEPCSIEKHPTREGPSEISTTSDTWASWKSCKNIKLIKQNTTTLCFTTSTSYTPGPRTNNDLVKRNQFSSWDPVLPCLLPQTWHVCWPVSEMAFASSGDTCSDETAGWTPNQTELNPSDRSPHWLTTVCGNSM